MKEEHLQLLRQLTPFPIVVNTGIIEGNLFPRLLMCKNCNHKECLNPNFTKPYCSNGFKIYDLNIPYEFCRFIGVITSQSRQHLPANLQRKYNNRVLDEKAFTVWASHIKDSILFVQDTIKRKNQEYIDGFHDITPTITLIIRNAEKLINMSGGNSLMEKFENSPEPIQTVYKSAELLNQNLKFMSYLTNPESIKYGAKHSTVMYKLVDKMCRIFNQSAQKRHINLRIDGNSFHAPKVYDSIGILTFILLENAIKYSYSNQDIIVSIKDTGHNDVFLDFMSYGPIIPKDEISKIFLKHYRYIHSSLDKDKVKGHGLGLYIASLIASKHGFEIKYNSNSTGIQKNGTNVGENHFCFEIPSDIND